MSGRPLENYQKRITKKPHKLNIFIEKPRLLAYNKKLLVKMSDMLSVCQPTAGQHRRKLMSCTGEGRCYAQAKADVIKVMAMGDRKF